MLLHSGMDSVKNKYLSVDEAKHSRRQGYTTAQSMSPEHSVYHCVSFIESNVFAVANNECF